MKTKKVLVALDFSASSEAVLQIATWIGIGSSAKLLIVHVVEPNVIHAESSPYRGIPDPANEEQLDILESMLPGNTSVQYEHRLIGGAATEAIVRFAEEENVDLVVMGTHGRTGVAKALMGSVAEAVSRHTPCPVLTFKQPASSVSSE